MALQPQPKQKIFIVQTHEHAYTEAANQELALLVNQPSALGVHPQCP
jgi:hypothetical protein